MNQHTLSPMAQNVLETLKNGGLWEYQLVDALFPRIPYGKTTAERLAYEQHSVNRVFRDPSKIYHVWIEKGMFADLSPTIPISHECQVLAAVKELKALGLIAEQNSGCNDYFFYLV